MTIHAHVEKAVELIFSDYDPAIRSGPLKRSLERLLMEIEMKAPAVIIDKELEVLGDNYRAAVG